MGRFVEMTASKVKKDLQALANPEKAKIYQRFFKTGKGEYGEGDVFIGLTVPQQRSVAKKYSDLPLDQVKILLHSEIHEHRLVAILILVHKFQKKQDRAIVSLYLKNRECINNWDLVDLSAHKIIGAYLENRNRKTLYKLAKSKSLWDRRIAIIATFWFINNNDFKDSLKIADILVNDKHDLIHKAVGWMLREIGKKDLKAEESFLNKHYKTMPRTMLRYAIERFKKKKKDFYMGR